MGKAKKETVRIAPESWTEIVPNLALLLVRGDGKAHQYAIAELYRMASLADLYVTSKSKGKGKGK